MCSRFRWSLMSNHVKSIRSSAAVWLGIWNICQALWEFWAQQLLHWNEHCATLCVIVQCPYPAPSLRRHARSEIAYFELMFTLHSASRLVLNHVVVMNHCGLFAPAAACWMTSVERLREDWCAVCQRMCSTVSLLACCKLSPFCQPEGQIQSLRNFYAHVYTRCWGGIARSRNSIGGWSLSVEFRTMVAVKTVCFDHWGGTRSSAT